MKVWQEAESPVIFGCNAFFCFKLVCNIFASKEIHFSGLLSKRELRILISAPAELQILAYSCGMFYKMDVNPCSAQRGWLRHIRVLGLINWKY